MSCLPKGARTSTQHRPGQGHEAMHAPCSPFIAQTVLPVPEAALIRCHATHQAGQAVAPTAHGVSSCVQCKQLAAVPQRTAEHKQPCGPTHRAGGVVAALRARGAPFTLPVDDGALTPNQGAAPPLRALQVASRLHLHCHTAGSSLAVLAVQQPVGQLATLSNAG